MNFMRTNFYLFIVFLLYSFNTYASTPSTPSFLDNGQPYHIFRGTYTYRWNSISNATRYEVEKTIDGSTSRHSLGLSTSYSETFTRTLTYVARIRACNRSGCSPWSANEVNIVRPYTKPNDTAVSAPSSSSTGRYTLTWSQPWGHGINSYRLERSMNGTSNWIVLSTANTRSYSESVSSSGTYNYRVMVCNVDNRCSNYSRIATVNVDILTPPTTPAFLDNGQPYHILRGTYTYRFSSVSKATHYEVEKSYDGSKSIVNLGSSTSYSETFTRTLTYVARIRACNAAGCSAWSANEVNIVRPYTKPNDTAITAPSSSSTGQYTLTWKQPWGHGITKYQLERSIGSTNNWQVISTRNALSYSENVTSSNTYYYRAIVCNIDNLCSNYSQIVSVNVSIAHKPVTPVTKPNFHGDLYYPINTSVSFCIHDQRSGDPATQYKIHTAAEGDSLAYSHTINRAQSCTPTSKSFGTLKRYNIAYQACNSAGCSAMSPTERIVIFDKPHTPTVTMSQSQVTTGENVSATINVGAGTIWSGAFYKASHTTPSGTTTQSEQRFDNGHPATNWDSPALTQAGNHTFSFVTCNKTAAYCSQSATYTVKVQGETPSVTFIDSSLGGFVFNEGESLRTTTAEAVNRVEYKQPNGTWTQASASNGYYSIPLTGLEIGKHSISARAVSTSGQVSRITTQDITIAPISANESTVNLSDFNILVKRPHEACLPNTNNAYDQNDKALSLALEVSGKLGKKLALPAGKLCVSTHFNITQPTVLIGSAIASTHLTYACQTSASLACASTPLISVNANLQLIGMTISHEENSEAKKELISSISKISNPTRAQLNELAVTHVGNITDIDGLSVGNSDINLTLSSVRLGGFKHGIIANSLSSASRVNIYNTEIVYIETGIKLQAAIPSQVVQLSAERLLVQRIIDGTFVDLHNINSKFDTFNIQASFHAAQTFDAIRGVKSSSDNGSSTLSVSNFYSEFVHNVFSLSNLKQADLSNLYNQGRDYNKPYRLGNSMFDINNVSTLNIEGNAGKHHWDHMWNVRGDSTVNEFTDQRASAAESSMEQGALITKPLFSLEKTFSNIQGAVTLLSKKQLFKENMLKVELRYADKRKEVLVYTSSASSSAQFTTSYDNGAGLSLSINSDRQLVLSASRALSNVTVVITQIH
ncbi:hypothetical protein [Pseudoalteromonas byunsanensis]|uniref:Fibronectin type-III domain-containing protein n=1 Tax=Pseudoalteromonas byunsanensis TaxID=327939 RepID=A0A1S1NBV6_9GAMM|nr:hypothetical protein [Pseudoalteromonas byunsanensis]OHU96907.1 hypothetical protein BIW53_03360 [Pseudoalteromonas byunsanensis]